MLINSRSQQGLVRLIAVAVVIAAGLFALLTTRAQEDPLPPTIIVRLNELELEIGESATLTATIECNAESACYGVQLVLRYRPNILRIEDIRAGAALASSGDTFSFQEIDAVNGTVSFAYLLNTGAVPDADADDTLIEIDMTGLEIGGSLMRFESILVITDSLLPDQIVGIPSYVNVIDPDLPAQFRLSEALPLRDVPSTDGRSLGSVAADQVGTILGFSEDGSWLYIENPIDGQRGWIAFNPLVVSVMRLETVSVVMENSNFPPTSTPSPVVETNTEAEVTAPPSVPTAEPTQVETNTEPEVTAPPSEPTAEPSEVGTNTRAPAITLTPTDEPTSTPQPTDTATATATVAFIASTPTPPANVRTICSPNAVRQVTLPSGVGELWVRDVPAGNRIATLANNNPVTILNQSPRFDRRTRQWWCFVLTPNTIGAQGWVEATLLR